MLLSCLSTKHCLGQTLLNLLRLEWSHLFTKTLPLIRALWVQIDTASDAFRCLVQTINQFNVYTLRCSAFRLKNGRAYFFQSFSLSDTWTKRSTTSPSSPWWRSCQWTPTSFIGKLDRLEGSDESESTQQILLLGQADWATGSANLWACKSHVHCHSLCQLRPVIRRSINSFTLLAASFSP